MDPTDILTEIGSISGPGRVGTIRRRAREVRRWILSQPPERQPELLKQYADVLAWIPVDSRKGDRHKAPRPEDRHKAPRIWTPKDGKMEWERAITAIDGEGWGVLEPEDLELVIDPAPDPWPPIQQYIRGRLGVKVPQSMVPELRPLGILPPGWGLGGRGKRTNFGVGADVLKVELPLEVPEAKGLWAPDASIEEMFHVLHQLWQDSTGRPRKTRVRWYGRQVYRLMVATTLLPNGGIRPRRLWDFGERLTTAQILNWISELPYPGHMIGFGLGYDWAHWLLDLADRSPDDLRALHRGETVRYITAHPRGTYDLKMIPGKFLEIRRLHPGKPRRRVIHDTFSWYQSSFQKAVSESTVVPQVDLKVIEAGKARRGDGEHDVDEESLYSMTENLSLCRMQKHLYELCQEAGFPLKRFNGPGSLAEVMLEQADVVSHFCPIPQEAEVDLLRAHYGGRFEDAAMGRFNKLYGYDISSAYPWAASHLPSFKGAQFERVQSWQPGELGLYRVRFGRSHERQYWGAFPVRGRSQEIFFPQAGETWVWSPELQAARGYWPFKVVEGWRVTLAEPHVYPLAFLRETYLRRRELKLQQDPLANVFRLGPNSLYGKLGQTVGEPRFRFLPWASLITSQTRALLLAAIRRAGPGQVIGTATDAIYVRRPLQLPTAGLGGLGDWEGPKPMSNVLLVGSGFMRYREAQKTRGVKPAEMEAESSLDRSTWTKLGKLWDGWQKSKEPWIMLGETVERQQFCSIGLGLLWNHPEMIGSWIGQERKVGFGSVKSPGIGRPVPRSKAVWRVQRSQDRPRVCYPYLGFKDYQRELEDAEEEGLGA